ncbi:hypothetical protein M3Y99_01898200 [Aphelenchoides fujianensis]|nr:hypothetical protein M3Y99_01898200 [Aphelenchoides fujianensis]
MFARCAEVVSPPLAIAPVLVQPPTFTEQLVEFATVRNIRRIIITGAIFAGYWWILRKLNEPPKHKLVDEGEDPIAATSTTPAGLQQPPTLPST